ncbi:DUF2840 domain-containing protein [Brucella pseudogrignonensis]|nr:DUF2840 domain-containing protein [Brucella pseudogrignonensis]MCD4512188.1 DUF2840 domain-containing protein [Brucella pseudogrignonensis]
MRPRRAEPQRPALTHVELHYERKQVEHWIRFGHPVLDHRIDGKRRVVSFEVGSVFAFVRWQANRYGTILSRIDIMMAVHPNEPYQTLPCVTPGGDILLRLNGWAKVERVLKAIDAIEALEIDPADASPDHWRYLHNRLTVNQPYHLYSAEQHKAWLLRRRIGS